MERKKLIAARGRLSQQALADAVGLSRNTISNIERGITDPQEACIKALCTFFGVEDPADLDLVPLPTTAQDRKSEFAMLQKRMNDLNLNRREILELVGSLPALAGINLPLLLESSGHIAPDDYLKQSHAAIQACWHLMQHDGLVHVDNIVKACAPKLTDLATQPSDIQDIAASLAAEAQSLQGLLAMHRLDYTGLRIHDAAAVRFGRRSDNRRLLATMLSLQGCTYSFHLASATRAIPIFKEGLANLNSNALLNKAHLSIGLALAYALNENEDEAIEMIKQARIAMPDQPELDPLYYLIDLGASDLDRAEGMTYLTLAEKLKSRDYAEQAYKTFARGASGKQTSDRSHSQTLIHQADSALPLDDFKTFAECLEHGLVIAFKIDSKRRLNEARTVLHKAPDAWRKENAYQNLVKVF